MAARSAPRGHLCRRSDYWVEQVEEIMRTEDTWMRWLPMDALGLVLDEPLALLPLAVEPVAPLPDVPGAVDDPVEPGAVDDPVDPVLPAPDADEPDELDIADASDPVTSTWWPLCCASSVSRPCRTYVEPFIAILPGEVLPAVPAVELPAPLVEPAVDPEPAPLDAVLPGEVLPGDAVEPGELLLEPLLLAPEPMRALVSMNVPLPVERDVLDVEPAVPLVPVAPGVLPLP